MLSPVNASRPTSRADSRITRGQCGSLLLHCRGLAPPTPCRSPGAPNARLKSRFARVRVRPAHDRDIPTEKIPEEWLLIEWPLDDDEPMKFWLSTLDNNVGFAHLVHMTKQRWRIERDYLELKQEVGLGHFEGRGWRGFHHHATLCIAAYAFLVAERATFSPSEARCGTIVEKPAVPENYRPRGAADPHSAPRARFDRDTAM